MAVVLQGHSKGAGAEISGHSGTGSILIVNN